MKQRIPLTARATFRNELRLLLRDPFCLVLLACFSAGLAWASWSSYRYWNDFSFQQSELQADAREAWLSQSTVNAHMATHVGQTVYKPISPLAGFDPGAVSDFGARIFLQSHYQSAARNRPSGDRVDIVQSEAYSPAVLLELVGPLLIIVLGLASIARDKEGGTLSILLTTGASWSAIIAGKGAAIMLVLYVVALPGLLLLLLPWVQGHLLFHPFDLFTREAVTVFTLTAYYLGWYGLTVIVASKSNSTSGSFSVLIAIWSIFALVMPRLAGDVADFVSPLPTHGEVRLEKEEAVHEANQASAELAKASKALEAKLLKEFKVDRIEDLPIDIAGARMIDLEKSTNRLYDDIEKRVADSRIRQNEVIAGFQFASPYMAMRTVSTSLAATDRAHHFDFVRNAESYRRQYVKELNTAEMKRRKPGSSPDERRKFWDQVSEFQPQFVSSVRVIGRSLSALICLLVWAAAAITASFYAVPNVSKGGGR